MKENTNGAIIQNAFFLYLRLAVVSISSLFVTRFALKALGVIDYGLYSVVGSIISFIAIINTMMLSTSNRFIATAIGKNDEEEINKVFNVNLVVHSCCSIAVFVIGTIIGLLYIYTSLKYDGDIHIAVYVFLISLIASCISFIGVPYNGLMMAKERFKAFCMLDVILYILKAALCYALLFLEGNRLIYYALIQTALTVLPVFFYFTYCRRLFPYYVKIHVVKDRRYYRQVGNFSIWVGYGALAQVGKSQGAAMLINAFFNTVMNTALGVANQVLSFVSLFTQNISKPISPQITKSYAKGDFERCTNLMVASSKLSYLMMLFISTPLLIYTPGIVELWLGTIPEYSICFIRLVIINQLVECLNMGISEYIFANGNIKQYQLITNSILLLSIFVGFIILKTGAPAYSLLVVYIIFSMIAVAVRQMILNVYFNFNTWIFVKKVYIPGIIATLFVGGQYFMKFNGNTIVNVILSYFLTFLIIYFLGFSRQDRMYIIEKIKALFKIMCVR